LTAGTGEAYAVLLEDSPAAVVDRNSLCALNAERAAAVRITGKATSVRVSRNWVDAWGPSEQSSAVLADDCEGDAPWIRDNLGLYASGDNASASVSTVAAFGDCHPVIEDNHIYGGSEGGAAATTGVHCGSSAQSSIASRCAIIDNPLIQPAQFGVPPASTGVRCDDGACLRVSGNVIDARAGVRTRGLVLARTGPRVSGNEIRGGCGTNTSFGVTATDSWARLDNNRIFAGACPNGGDTQGLYIGINSVVLDGPAELDVHSNHIDGDGSPVTCRSAGISMVPGPVAPAAGTGRFRNNIIRAGRCSTAHGIEELGIASDPSVLWNNDLAPLDSPTGLYRDEGATDLTDIAQVNALTDLSAQANLSADPQQVNYPSDLHLATGSVCIDAGTAAGAPATDMDGHPRDATPDIGPDEL
ncbi:MAG TPA: choice-of-anchor Q domain-containing protein, partial [Actinoplanes sp.]|nr:choice-of-anchor Q domain-containing protein [Actinoplanes sp.]